MMGVAKPSAARDAHSFSSIVANAIPRDRALCSRPVETIVSTSLTSVRDRKPHNHAQAKQSTARTACANVTAPGVVKGEISHRNGCCVNPLWARTSQLGFCVQGYGLAGNNEGETLATIELLKPPRKRKVGFRQPPER